MAGGLRVAIIGYLPLIRREHPAKSLSKLVYYVARTLLRRGCTVDFVPHPSLEPKYVPGAYFRMGGKLCEVLDYRNLPKGEYDVGLVVASPHMFARSRCLRAAMAQGVLDGAIEAFRASNPHAKVVLYGTLNYWMMLPASLAEGLRIFDMVIFYTRYECGMYEELCEEAGVKPVPHTYVTPGVDSSHYTPAPGEGRGNRPFTVLYVGRNDIVKAPSRILGVASLLRDLPIKFVLFTSACGFSPVGLLDLTLLSQSLRLREGEDINFVEEFVEEESMPSVYRAADAFITLSSSEGVCLSMLEAQACGLPVVAHSLPTLREVYGNSVLWVGSEGVEYYPIGPAPVASVKEAAEKVRDLYLEEGLRKEYRARSLENAKRYDWDESVGPRLKETLESSLSL